MGSRILVVDDSATIRKVVAAILARHDFVPLEASDGIEALQLLSEAKPDLVLVDFVMPRMNGYQFCMTLRQNPEFGDLPVVLMSAKGDKIRGKFVQQTGALDAITKPFDARGLLAVIQSALTKRSEEGRRRSEPPRADEDPLSGPGDSSPDNSISTRVTHSALRISEHLAKLVLPELSRMGYLSVKQNDLSRAFAQALTPEAARELAGLVSEAELGGEASDEVLSGDLASISIAEILQLLDLQRKTGALTLSHKRARVTLFIREGSLDFATYAGLPEEFLLGRYLVETGALDRQRLDECIEQSRKGGQLLGDYLVRSELLSPQQLDKALANQTSELLYEVVRWRTGRFRFQQRSDTDLAARAKLSLPTAGLVMEGFRRVDEWRLIEDSFDFGDVLFRDDLFVSKLSERSDLTEVERRVLDAIDGETTVGELVDNLEGSSFEICKVLYRLLNSRLVKRQGQTG